MTRDAYKQLSEETLVALRCQREEWPRGLMSETPIPDTWMGLALRRDGGRRFVPAGEEPRLERDDTLVLVRNRAITVPLTASQVSAACGNLVDGEVELLLRWHARDDDLAALKIRFLDQPELTLDRLADAVAQAGGGAALQAAIRARAAAELVRVDIRDDLADRLRNELSKLLFSSGAVLERLGRVAFRSESYERQAALERSTSQRLRELEARGRVEQAALAAAQHRLGGLGEILEKLQAAASADEQLAWHDLLPTLTPGERGRLLENLWRLTPNRTTATAIVAVAGRECLWLDIHNPAHIARRVTLPDDLGGLRCVGYDANAHDLLIGAALGVWRLDAETGDQRGRYAVPDRDMPRTGFNAVALHGEHIYATHSQLGAWRWNLAEHEAPFALLEPAAGVPRTVRAVTTDAHGRVLLATDDRVRAFDQEGQTLWQSAPAGDAIHCIAPLDDDVYIGTSAGSLLRTSLIAPGEWIAVHRAFGVVESIAARRWDDLIELVIPAGRQGVTGVYATEGIVSRLLDAEMGIRRTWACDDTLLALTSQRDRLLVLGGDLPERTGVEIPLARLTGHSVQDACLITKQTSSAGSADDMA